MMLVQYDTKSDNAGERSQLQQCLATKAVELSSYQEGPDDDAHKQL